MKPKTIATAPWDDDGQFDEIEEITELAEPEIVIVPDVSDVGLATDVQELKTEPAPPTEEAADTPLEEAMPPVEKVREHVPEREKSKKKGK
jgi:hypothetical protein